MSVKVLVGDVGGTNSRWAIYQDGLGPVVVRPTSSSRTLAEATGDWIDEVDACGVAVAGPVSMGRVSLTNAKWEGAESDMGKPTRLVNDLEAVALAVPLLDETALEWWSDPNPSASRVLCVGVGTGFGGAMWTPDGVTSMEPGHDPLVGFGRYGRQVTVEDVVSGMGLARMRSEGHDAEVWLSEAFSCAIGRLIKETRAEAVFLIGGVVVGHDYLFRDRFPGGFPVAKITHPYPALLGAAAAAMGALSMTD